MMYGSGEVLVWWAFVSGVSFIALLVGVFALVSRWAAPSAEESVSRSRPRSKARAVPRARRSFFAVRYRIVIEEIPAEIVIVRRSRAAA
jgi:hypothetical protein